MATADRFDFILTKIDRPKSKSNHSRGKLNMKKTMR